MSGTLALEDKNRKNGMRISIAVHLLLLLIAFIYVLPQVDKEALEDKPPYAVKVDFTFEESSMSTYAHDDEGAQRAANEDPMPQESEKVDDEVANPQQEAVQEQPQPTDPVAASTTTTEDESPVEVKEEPRRRFEVPDFFKPKAEEPAPVKPEKTTPAPPPAPTPAPVSTSPSTSSNANGSGTSNAKGSVQDGNGTGKGSQGTGDGKTKGNDGDEGMGNSSSGTGEYDGSGDGVFGRKVIYRDTRAAASASKLAGTVAVKICVDRGGIVTYTEIIEEESNLRDRRSLINFMKAARKYKVQPDSKAPKEQCGKLIFVNKPRE